MSTTKLNTQWIVGQPGGIGGSGGKQLYEIGTYDGQSILVMATTRYGDAAERIVRAVNSHADMLEALEQAAKLMPLGTAIRAEWLTKASALLAKAKGGAA